MMFPTLEVGKFLKDSMGYSENKCSGCQHFKAADLGGRIDSKPAHCALNPSVWLVVDLSGHCNHFKANED